MARNFIGNSVNTSYPATYKTNQNVLTIEPGDTVQIASGAFAGNVYKYLGSQPITVLPATYTASTSTPTTVKPGQSVEVPAGTDGVTSATVYQYIGSTNLSNPDLKTENYSDPTMWQQVTALEQDYTNPSLWQQVNVSSNPLQVEAYVHDSGISAKGAYTVTANSDQDIHATVAAPVGRPSVAAVANLAGGCRRLGVSTAMPSTISCRTDVQADQDRRLRQGGN